MKKTKSLLTLVFLSAILVSAQELPPPPPPAAPDYSPDSWKEYSFKEESVRFRFPVEPKRTELTGEKGFRFERRSFMSFSLEVSDAGIDVGTNKDSQKKYLILISMTLEESAKKDGTKILKNEDTTVDGIPAKFFVMESKDGTVTRAKVFILKDKVYSAETNVRKGERHGFNWENDFEKPAMAFLDSVRLISK